ncbi:MAG: adenylate cyclase [Acidobacteria bacterium]|nr:adenylate cyclase [Acidobacteriota bacterium]
MKEIEIKLAIDDADEARRRLGEAGAVALAARSFEDNRLYDDAARSLKSSGRLLRIRAVGGRNVLTFKAKPDGPAGDARYKIRDEYETEIADAAELDRVLRALGFEPAYRYQKYRQPYRLGGVEVLLDETRLGGVEVLLDETPVGNFLELEGPPEAIDAAARTLGFAPADYDTRTYRELHQARTGREEPGDMVFPETA